MHSLPVMAVREHELAIKQSSCSSTNSNKLDAKKVIAIRANLGSAPNEDILEVRMVGNA